MAASSLAPEPHEGLRNTGGHTAAASSCECSILVKSLVCGCRDVDALPAQNMGDCTSCVSPFNDRSARSCQHHDFPEPTGRTWTWAS